MRKKNQKGFLIALCLCMLSLSGIYGVYQYQKSAAPTPEEQSAQLEQDAFEFCHNDIWLFVVVRKISVFIQDGKFSPSLFPLKPEYFLSDATDEQCLHQSAHAEVAEKGCPEPDVCLLAEEENGEERERGGRH